MDAHTPLKKYLALILASYPGAWCFADMQGRIIALNEPMAQFYGARPVEELVGQLVTDVSSDPARALRARERVLQHGYCESEQRHTYHGGTKSVRYSAWVVHDKGRQIGIASFARETATQQVERLMLPEEVQNYLRISYSTLRRWVQAGTLPAFQIERQWRFRPHDVQAWLDKQKLD